MDLPCRPDAMLVSSESQLNCTITNFSKLRAVARILAKAGCRHHRRDAGFFVVPFAGVIRIGSIKDTALGLLPGLPYSKLSLPGPYENR